ncbi:MAG: LysM peptidoglycan-binding domain-containing protein [Ilumatobacteraceae bacterium]
MALALHPSSPTFIYSGTPQRRKSHLRLVVTEPVSRQHIRRTSAQIYRRRRLAVATAALGLLAVAIFGLVGIFGGPARADENTPNRVAAPHVVIAQSGDTLWAIARRVVPVGNITELVDQLVLMNGAEITAGQEVRLP